MYANVNNIKFLITNKHDAIQKKLLQGKQWNNNIMDIILDYIHTTKAKHFVNIGSHIGTLVIPISKHIDKCTAIEAYPPTYKHLCANIKLNNITNIDVINIAVGNKQSDIYFMRECDRVINNSGGMHVLTLDDIENNRRSSHLTDKKIIVKMDTLDNINLTGVDIMLIDIEGFEYNLLLGCKNTIMKYKPIIIIEIWDNVKRRNENMNTTREQIIYMICAMNYKLIDNIGDDHIFEPI